MKVSFLLLSAFLVLAQSRSVPGNAVIDVERQKDKPLRCWEEVNNKLELSEPKYPMCQHMSEGRKIFHVGGVELESDDYTNILAIFGNSEDSFGYLNVCLQEAFALNGPQAQAVVSFRCLCKRDGCNLPAPLLEFIEFNNNVIRLP